MPQKPDIIDQLAKGPDQLANFVAAGNVEALVEPSCGDGLGGVGNLFERTGDAVDEQQKQCPHQRHQNSGDERNLAAAALSRLALGSAQADNGRAQYFAVDVDLVLEQHEGLPAAAHAVVELEVLDGGPREIGHDGLELLRVAPARALGQKN